MQSRLRHYFKTLKSEIAYWHPSVSDPKRVARELREFYRTRADYHAMTADPTKPGHPQVRLLSSLVRPTDTCIDFGCGGGVVLRHLSLLTRRVIGIDIAPALGGVQADISRAPIRSETADVVYSLEVLEHVWDPEAVILEMIRVLKPGGLFFLSTPNGYGIHVYMSKRKLPWLVNYAGALFASCVYFRSKRIFRNTEPDLKTYPAYPDCDMISKTFPSALKQFVERAGCKVERLETFLFLKERSTSAQESEWYSQLERHRFMRYFGDHILLVARKQ